MKLTKAKAKELSIEKWELIIANDGKSLRYYPEYIDSLMNNCGYCEKYLNLPSTGIKACGKCPLIPKKVTYPGSLGCLQPGHPYNKWTHDNTVENAQAVLDLIKNT